MGRATGRELGPISDPAECLGERISWGGVLTPLCNVYPLQVGFDAEVAEDGTKSKDQQIQYSVEVALYFSHDE